MTEIVRKAWAGTLESSDVYVELEPLAGRLEINLESVVYRQFGSRILEVARETLAALAVRECRLSLNDRGALDCVIRARIETAVGRGKGGAE